MNVKSSSKSRNQVFMAHEDLNKINKGVIKMSLLDTKKLPVLAGKYDVTIKSYKEITNDKGGYIETILQLPDREYTYCIFPSQINYVTGCLAKQFNVEDETTLGDLLEQATKQSFNAWFNYNTTYNRYNIALLETKVVSEEAPEL